MEEGAVAQVEFAYTAQESDELTLAVGDLVQNCAQKEDGKTYTGVAGDHTRSFTLTQK